MIEILTALSNAITFEGFIRLIELAVMLYIVRLLGGMQGQIKDLHKWHDHDVIAAPGTKIWWVDPKVMPCMVAMEKHLAKIAGEESVA